MTFREFITSAFSDGKDISFGRLACGALLIYFCALDAWFFHRTGTLVRGNDLLMQLAWPTSYYCTNKITALFGADAKPTA